jgi:hypothetical protein
MHHIVNMYKKKSSHTIVWLVGVGSTTSRRAVGLVRLWVTREGCMVNLHPLKNNMKMNENEGTERLMIENILKLQEAARREVVVREVGTAALEFLTAVPFAIQVAMQWISFKSIAKCLIENEIVKSTNLNDNLLLSEGLSVEVIPLPHCIILLPLDFIPLPLLFLPPPHFFIPLPQSLLKHFDILSFFWAARDEATPPYAL